MFGPATSKMASFSIQTIFLIGQEYWEPFRTVEFDWVFTLSEYQLHTRSRMPVHAQTRYYIAI